VIEIIEIELGKYLSTQEYNPSPHRLSLDETPVSDRTIPIVYICEECGFHISFKPDDFEKHKNSQETNLREEDKKAFKNYIDNIEELHKLSYLDFYCPKCNQSTVILFQGTPSGYWGMFELKIEHILVLKNRVEVPYR